jgi:hypothetical protein
MSRRVVVTSQSVQNRYILLAGIASLVLLVGLISYELGQSRAGFSRINAQEDVTVLEAVKKTLAKQNKSILANLYGELSPKSGNRTGDT